MNNKNLKNFGNSEQDFGLKGGFLFLIGLYQQSEKVLRAITDKFTPLRYDYFQRFMLGYLNTAGICSVRTLPNNNFSKNAEGFCFLKMISPRRSVIFSDYVCHTCCKS